MHASDTEEELRKLNKPPLINDMCVCCCFASLLYVVPICVVAGLASQAIRSFYYYICVLAAAVPNIAASYDLMMRNIYAMHNNNNMHYCSVSQLYI